jgi:hypothetical protein
VSRVARPDRSGPGDRSRVLDGRPGRDAARPAASTCCRRWRRGLRFGNGTGLAERFLRQTVGEQSELEAWSPWLITISDRLVRPAKQRELALALNADVIEIEADHDLPLVNGAEYARLTRFAVDTVAATAEGA